MTMLKKTQRLLLLLAMLLVATNVVADEYSRSVTGGRQIEDINYTYRISGGKIKLEQKGDSYADYIKYGSEAAVREAGKMGVEGKDYIVQDGDIMHFRFNV